MKNKDFEEYARVMASLPTIDEVLKDSPFLKAYASGGLEAALKELQVPALTDFVDFRPATMAELEKPDE
jgi:hypothetical protein